MANQYDTNLKLQAIADAIGDSQSSGLIQALEDIADAVAGGGGGGSSTAGLVSDNFSETDTYDLGDYCIHNNTLYVCINAITTPGAWDLSDWQATNAGIQLSSLNSALDIISDKLPTIVGNYSQSSALFYNSWGALMACIAYPFPASLLNTKYYLTLTSVDLGYRDKANVALDLTKINPPNTRGEITLNTAMTAAGISDLLTFVKEYPHGCRINFTISEITQ